MEIVFLNFFRPWIGPKQSPSLLEPRFIELDKDQCSCGESDGDIEDTEVSKMKNIQEEMDDAISLADVYKTKTGSTEPGPKGPSMWAPRTAPS